MGITIAIKKSPPPPEPEWVSVFNDTYWKSQANAFWDGSQWIDFGQEGMALTPADGVTWYQGFRPTKMRITGTVSFADSTELRFSQSASDVIGKVTSPFTSPLEVDLDWSDGQDLVVLVMSIWTPVTNIEFLGGTLG